MNINVQDNNIGKKRLILIISIVVLCIIAVFIAVYIQWFKEKSLEEFKKETEQRENNLEETEKLEKNFDEIFLNDLKKSENIETKIVKNEENKEIVYSKYKGIKESENEYSLNINIPYINIESSLITQYNEEIKSIFVTKLEKILKEKTNEIYTVEYTSNINNNILSIIIKSTLKQQGGAQRIIIKTFCYDIKNDKALSLQEMLKEKNISSADLQEEIIQKIKEKQNESIALQELGYEIYKRDYTDKMYLITNITDFYINEEGYIYIIFAYGNKNNTGEMDMIVI